jgi:hypothetical protein
VKHVNSACRGVDVNRSSSCTSQLSLPLFLFLSLHARHHLLLHFGEVFVSLHTRA